MTDKEVAKTGSSDFGLDDSDMNMIIMMMMMFVMMSMMASGLGNTFGVISQQASAQSYSGINDPRLLNITRNLTYIDLINEKPYQPWMIAFIVNRGPSDVYVAINYPGETFIIEPGGTRTINRSGAQERIGVIFFNCDPGRSTVVSITGEY